MNLNVNGKSHEHAGDATIPVLLNELGAVPEHSAVTVNGDVITSKKWGDFHLKENDTVEVLTFVGGG